jgi:hypothetical protein
MGSSHGGKFDDKLKCMTQSLDKTSNVLYLYEFRFIEFDSKMKENA